MLSASDGLSSGTHFPAKAKRVIQIFCSGGLSHVDTFDYKPELERRAGTPFDPDGKLQFFASKPGNCQPSFWKFRRHGQSGIWMSDLLPKLATCVDDMAFIYSMQSKTALHGPGNFMMNTGQILPALENINPIEKSEVFERPFNDGGLGKKLQFGLFAGYLRGGLKVSYAYEFDGLYSVSSGLVFRY